MSVSMRLKLIHPERRHLEQALARLRKPHWPATLDDALRHPTCGPLVRGLGTGLARAEASPRQAVDKSTTAAQASPPDMPTPPLTAGSLTVAQICLLEQRVARRAIVADVEELPIDHVDTHGRKWRDVRPMLDEREHASQVIAMAREALDLGVETGLLAQHTQRPYLIAVRFAYLAW